MKPLKALASQTPSMRKNSAVAKVPPKSVFPVDPLGATSLDFDDSIRRRHIQGILESYNGNYDALAEMVQNSVDALEDASLAGLPGPFLLAVDVNLKQNWISVLDTGTGMSAAEIVKVCAPHASLKPNPNIAGKRDKRTAYRGYKGVGLTFLAYGTDDITIHSKNSSGVTKARMKLGRAWVDGRRKDAALLVEDSEASPLDGYQRGTFVKFQCSSHTRPKSLSHQANSKETWDAILRTKTAIGQVLLERTPVVKIDVTLNLSDESGLKKGVVSPEYLYPHKIKRPHAFRFLDIPKYYKTHSENSEPPDDKRRQDGLYLVWDTEKITDELTADQKKQYLEELTAFTPAVYAFMPYQGAVWTELNNLSSGRRLFLKPGLTIAVNRQRLMEQDEIAATRYEVFSRNIFVLVHFDNARPDLGRKTLQSEVNDLAQKIADRVVQYIAKQRAFLRPSGEAPTADKRDIERNHNDWEYNVRSHADKMPLHIPPVTYVSEPLVEQDVVGLFHQLSVLGVFPGVKVYATSQSKTYDCLVQFECGRDTNRLIYDGLGGKNPLGVSPYILGAKAQFRSAMLTLEFKNNLDGLVEDLEGAGKKQFSSIDVCVCWRKIGIAFRGFELTDISESNVDQRAFPGVTHVLRKDGDAHVMQIILLGSIVDLIKSGQLAI